MTVIEIWTFRNTAWSGTNLEGFKVEATDGEIGKVDEATYETGGSYIVVDTGPWIFGKKVMIPAGAVERVDAEEKEVFVGLTKDEIKNAPEFDEEKYQTDDYRSSLGSYYERQKAHAFVDHV
jgi:hypothetical protein